MSLPLGAVLESGSVPAAMKLPPGAELESGATPGSFQTQPGGKIYNASTLGSEPLTPIPGTSAATAAKARAALPQFPQQVQQSKNEEAQMLPEVGATVMSEGGPTGMALGAAAGTLLKPFLNGEQSNLNDAATNALKTYIASKAFDLLPAGAQKVYHFFAGDTSEVAAWRAANAALGVKASQVKMATGTSDLADAWNIPGRSVVNETGLTAKQLSKMSPLEQAAAIKPHLDAAGQKVANIADAATQSGTTLNLTDPITKAIGTIDDPAVRQRALDVVSRIAQDKGYSLNYWQAASPNDALELRQALWDSLPSRYRGQVYGAVTGQVKTVPGMADADQVYTELRTASDAVNSQAKKMAVTAPLSAWDQVINRLKKNAVPIAAGAAGSATGIPALGYVLRRFLPGGDNH